MNDFTSPAYGQARMLDSSITDTNNSASFQYAHTEAIPSITPDELVNYDYSKKKNFELFKKNNFDRILFGREVTLENSSITDYQELLIFSFISQNIPEGSRILGIGEKSDRLLKHFQYRYECWKIENAESLGHDFSDFQNESPEVFLDNNGIVRSDIPPTKFSFVFSVSAFKAVDGEYGIFNTIRNNLLLMVCPGGYAIHCFTELIEENGHLNYSRVLNYLNRKITPVYQNVQRFDGLKLKSILFADQDLFFTHELSGDIELLQREKKSRTISYNLLWKNNSLELPVRTMSRKDFYFEKSPVYIFHHLMKCGGSSIKEILPKWFNVEYDYVEGFDNLNDYLRYKLNLENVTGDTCVAGHFQYDGIHISQRYPTAWHDHKRFRLFSFIRDPLEFRISLYYYKGRKVEQKNHGLSKVIMYQTNVLASLFPCDETNYKKVIDRYFFIGLVEKMQESIDKFSDLINKKRIKIPFTNKSQKDSQIYEISPMLVDKFKNRNKLDYLIYEYCQEKFQKNVFLSLIYFLFAHPMV